jgi:8-oxo-dGTP diphosphatase
MEECGIKTRSGKLLLLAESLPPDKHRHVLNLVYLGEVVDGEAHLAEQGGDRLKGVAWRKKADLAGLTFFPDIKDAVLRHWSAGFTLPAESLGDLWKD